MFLRTSVLLTVGFSFLLILNRINQDEPLVLETPSGYSLPRAIQKHQPSNTPFISALEYAQALTPPAFLPDEVKIPEPRVVKRKAPAKIAKKHKRKTSRKLALARR